MSYLTYNFFPISLTRRIYGVIGMRMRMVNSGNHHPEPLEEAAQNVYRLQVA